MQQYQISDISNQRSHVNLYCVHEGRLLVGILLSKFTAAAASSVSVIELIADYILSNPDALMRINYSCMPALKGMK